jgi:hypothetical protein
VRFQSQKRASKAARKRRGKEVRGCGGLTIPVVGSEMVPEPCAPHELFKGVIAAAVAA